MPVVTGSNRPKAAAGDYHENRGVRARLTDNGKGKGKGKYTSFSLVQLIVMVAGFLRCLKPSYPLLKALANRGKPPGNDF